MRQSRRPPSLNKDLLHSRSVSLSYTPSPSWVIDLSSPSPVTTTSRGQRRLSGPRRAARRIGLVWRMLRFWERPLAIVVGILLGLQLARSQDSAPSSSPAWSRKSARVSLRSSSIGQKLPLPSLDQRLRLLELMATLSPHHTSECTRTVQPLYAAQTKERYAPLEARARASWLSSSSWFGSSQGQTRQERILSDLARQDHRYFFALNLFNSFDVIPDIFATLLRVSAILGFGNVYWSIYENGSKDQTKALLKLFDAVGAAAGLRMNIRTSARVRGSFNHRIEYLAGVRNEALYPMYELRDSTGETFDSILFMNDILPCVDDVLELIWQSRKQNAGITCAADYMWHEASGAPVFYDAWVSRDINGTAFNNAPFEEVVVDHRTANSFTSHLPFQVQACWNGAVIMDSAPFYSSPRVAFRMGDLASGECSASECSLIGNDYAVAGYGRIIVVPRVKLAYDNKVFPVIHPPRLNLTQHRQYARIGGLPENPRTDPQDNRWYGPHDRLFVDEESQTIDFVPLPAHVWCHGWDGAGDLDEPDMDPVWEAMSPESQSLDAIKIHRDRGF